MRKYLFGSTVLTFALIVTVSACGKGNVKQATQASSKEATVASSEKQQESGEKTEGEESGEVLSEDQAKREGEKEFKDSPEKAAAYLKTYFAIQVPETAEGKAFSEALQKITEKEIPITGEFDRLKAISAAVDASGYRELAQSYTAEKLQERLQRYGLKGEGEELSPLEKEETSWGLRRIRIFLENSIKRGRSFVSLMIRSSRSSEERRWNRRLPRDMA